MIDLLLDCAIFKPLSVGINNVCQISGRSTYQRQVLLKILIVQLGKSLSNIPPYRSAPSIAETPRAKASSELFFVRSRVFYARPGLNTRGQVQFGLRHIREQDSLEADEAQLTMHV